MQKAGKNALFLVSKRGLALLPALIFALFAVCCSPNKASRPARREIFAMDTYMDIACYGENAEAAAEAAVREIERIDALLSVESTSGSIYNVNKNKTARLDAESALIIKKALEINKSTHGAFDITVLPLMELWGFLSGEYRVPEKSEIDAALSHVGSEKLTLYGSEFSLGEALGIDLGGIAKGYTSDRLMELFRSMGITSACVSLGGNVQCLGEKSDGSAWRCAIVHPLDKDGGEYLGILSVRDRAVITSGAYERNFTDEKTGKVYHHIIDPKSGCPAFSGLVSVTVVSESGMLADALSTALYIMGLEGAVEYWRSSEADFGMVLMTDEGEVFITPDIAEDFTSSLGVNIISRR